MKQKYDSKVPFSAELLLLIDRNTSKCIKITHDAFAKTIARMIAKRGALEIMTSVKKWMLAKTTLIYYITDTITCKSANITSRGR